MTKYNDVIIMNLGDHELVHYVSTLDDNSALVSTLSERLDSHLNEENGQIKYLTEDAEEAWEKFSDLEDEKADLEKDLDELQSSYSDLAHNVVALCMRLHPEADDSMALENPAKFLEDVLNDKVW